MKITTTHDDSVPSKELTHVFNIKVHISFSYAWYSEIQCMNPSVEYFCLGMQNFELEENRLDVLSGKIRIWRKKCVALVYIFFFFFSSKIVIAWVV